MNVLVLTPDAVGSTLLQRMITILMQFHEFGRPVINLHELTNGLAKYWSPDFNREMLGKKNDKWGYYQSLPEVIELLDSVDHYKVARLAEYHINRRQDTIAEQQPFYRYLDENFYVIACRRENVFEHAISMCINRITKTLNVYSAHGKIDKFYDLYRDPVKLQPNILIDVLEEYKSYLDWSERHFNIASVFHYDQDLGRIEDYILELPIFSAQKRTKWRDVYGMTFQEWNRCHYYGSNLGGVLENQSQDTLRLPGPSQIQNNQDFNFPITEFLPQEQQKFIEKHRDRYEQASTSIEKMRELGILVTGIPVKKQTFKEKMHMVANFQDMINTYNDWIAQNPTVGKPIDQDVIQSQIEKEHQGWIAPLLEDSTSSNSHLISGTS